MDRHLRFCHRFYQTLQHLLTLHPNAGIVISGDRNSIDIPTLLNIEPSNTRGHRALDIILFNESVIVPAIFTDNPNKGVQSDHSGVVATPYNPNGGLR